MLKLTFIKFPDFPTFFKLPDSSRPGIYFFLDIPSVGTVGLTLPWMAGRSIAMLVSPQPWIIPILCLSSELTISEICCCQNNKPQGSEFFGCISFDIC